MLSLPIATLRFHQGDTMRLSGGNRHGGAQSMHMGGTALVLAVEDRLAGTHALAARRLQAAPEPANLAAGRPPGAFRQHDQSVRPLQFSERLPHRRGRG